MLEERKRALQEVQAVQKTEQQATGTLDTQILQLNKDLSKTTLDFEKKQLSFLNDIVALRPKIYSLTQRNPMDQAIQHSLQSYDEKIGEREIIEQLIID